MQGSKPHILFTTGEVKMPGKHLSLGCVVMAAGNSIRFGKNKLLSKFEGKTLIERSLDAVPKEEMSKVCVVTQYEEISKLSDLYGFLSVENHRPEEGVSLSVRLGTERIMDSVDAILYMVSDQPCLRRESVKGLISFYRSHPGNIIGASCNGKRGNPCIFPKKHFPALCSLKGDKGGSSVIRSNMDELLLFEMEERELSDVDTLKDLHLLES